MGDFIPPKPPVAAPIMIENDKGYYTFGDWVFLYITRK